MWLILVDGLPTKVYFLQPIPCPAQKNSWGTHWNDGGYGLFRRNNQGCSIFVSMVIAEMNYGTPLIDDARSLPGV